jgi:hypothetical protein
LTKRRLGCQATAARPTSPSSWRRRTTRRSRTPANGSAPRSRTSPASWSAGGPVAQQQAKERVERDLRTAELYTFPILFLLSPVFFRSLVAAALPLLVGGLTIVGTMLMLSVASELGSISIFALNLVIGLGFGLSIDYSLFMSASDASPPPLRSCSPSRSGPSSPPR